MTVTQSAIVLLPPANVTASDGLPDKVAVTWTATSSATGYDVYRAAVNDSAVATKLNASPVVGSSFDDTTVTAGVGHFYWVKSRNGALESAAFSNSDAGIRPTVVPPSIATPPLSRVVRLGGSTTLAVVATGGAPLTYQWKKDAVAIDGATSATLAINNAQFAQAGAYTVTVTNTQGSPTSAPAQLAVVKAEQSFTGGYTPGGTATIGVAISFAGAPVALGLDAILPDGWSYAGGTDEPATKPIVGTTSVLGWAWDGVPTSPIAFSYRLNVPTGDSEGKSIRGRLVFRQDSGPSDVLLLPDPLELSNNYTADTDRDSRISLIELTRVIEIYNTRNGTVRTG
ncbi:MAG: immunoglobulin domain-containing protein, partial [Rhodoglobus sp.]|nr:immunoglobulin domain-containing protein [Rhodoglobus sp.]